MWRSNRNAGFTLLEVVVALAVLAIALIALLTLRSRDIALQAHARHLVTATALAKMKLEELNRVAGARDQERSGDFGERYPGYRWTSAIDETPLAGWLEVRVEVLWPEGARQERVELVTYVQES
jgi:general secretion pathway protein I